VHHVRYPYCFRYCTHGADDVCPIAEGEDIFLAFSTSLPPDTVAAIIVEPIQGEGGFVVPPAAFLPSLRQICDDYGILLIVDEVQSGFGRSGEMFAVQHTSVTPDIMCVAKALANGLPIGAIVAKHAVMRAWSTGEHGTTFGGNAVACAAATAVIETLQRERIPQRAAKLGAAALERARGWQRKLAALGDVRGRGLMIGLEFMRGDAPDTALAQSIQRGALERGLLLLTCGPDDNVIRLLPPLTIPEDELTQGMDILEAAITENAA
jgi:4-aminobutyrate aminotransferase